MDEWWNRPSGSPESPAQGEGQAESQAPATATCPWCSASAAAGTATCPSCGAAMSQRESLGGIAIPGVTQVDPSMVPRSLTQSTLRAGATMRALDAVGRSAGADVQLVVAGAMLAGDGLKGVFQGAQDPSQVGEVSQAALDMARRLDADPDDSPAPDGEGPESETPTNQPG
jgi:hypothetical protein